MARSMFVTVTISGPSAYITGPGAKRLIEAAGGRGVWVRSRRAWAAQAHVGANVLVLCDRKNIPVAYTGRIAHGGAQFGGPAGGGHDDAA